MADKSISDLIQALQITGEDLFVLEQNGEAKKLKGKTLLDFITLNVVSVTVTTLPAGSSATATYDTSTNTLALGIPQGKKGDTGATGATGPANTLKIGTVTSGSEAGATIAGTAPDQTLDLVLPKGDKGATGEKGNPGVDGPVWWFCDYPLAQATSVPLTSVHNPNGPSVTSAGALRPRDLILSAVDGYVKYVNYIAGTGVDATVNLMGYPLSLRGNTGATGSTGPQGPAGADGYTPQRGVDYWTTADQQAIVYAVLAALPDGDEVSY